MAGIFDKLKNKNYCVAKVRSPLLDYLNIQDVFIIIMLEDISKRHLPNWSIEVIEPYSNIATINLVSKLELDYADEFMRSNTLIFEDENTQIYGQNEYIKDAYNQNKCKEYSAQTTESL